jgi:hypothetical protein
MRSARREGQRGAHAIDLGVDVSTARWAVAVRPRAEFCSAAHDQPAVSRGVKRRTALNCTRVVVAATGGDAMVRAAAIGTADCQW